MAASKHKVGTMRVRGTDYNVLLEVFERTGDVPRAVFTIEGLTKAHGHSVHAQTWEDLYKAAMLASKRASVKIEIPFMQVAWKRGPKDRYTETVPYFRAGKIVGKHVGNQNILITWDDDERAKVHQVADYHEDEFFRPINETRQNEYHVLKKEEDRIKKQVDKFEEQYKFNPNEEVEAEIERKASEIPNE